MNRKLKAYLTDSELLTRYQSERSERDLAELLDRHLEAVHGQCLYYLTDVPTAEDAVMEIYLQLRDKVHQHPIRNWRAWLLQLTKNHCLMQLRKKSRSLTQYYDPALMHSEDLLHPEDDGDREQLLAWLMECMEGLSEHQQEAIRRFYLSDQNYAEIGVDMNWSHDQIRSYMQNGRRNLKKCIENKRAHVQS